MIGLGLEETLLQYLRAVGWSVTAAVGFAFGVGIALKVFDYLSTDIDEWEEIKKGNQDALDKLKAGASLIQLYTGFIYNGPSFARNINKEIIKSLN